MRKATKSLIIVFVLSVFTYIGLYLLFVFMSPLPYRWMDLDKDGLVELSDTFRAIDIGVKEVQINGKTCSRYYYLKDGLEVHLDCG